MLQEFRLLKFFTINFHPQVIPSSFT